MDRGDFEEMLAQYKSNYVQFLTTGNDAYKTAYQNAQDALEKMVSAKQQEVETQKKDMQHFARSYAEGNGDLAGEYDKAEELHANAQSIEDDYEAAKNRYDMYTEKTAKIMPALDTNNGYAILLRFGVLLFLIPLLFLLGYYSPMVSAPSSSSYFSGMGMGSPYTFTSPAMSPAMTPAARGWLW